MVSILHQMKEIRRLHLHPNLFEKIERTKPMAPSLDKEN
jgi:hypothetical protein